jgi:hypothetical protein
MSFIKASSDIDGVPEDQFKRFVQIFLQDAQRVVNGSIELLKNVKLKSKTITFTAANTNVTVQHGLGFTPNGYIMAGGTAAMVIYDGSVTKSSSNITLKSSAAGTATILFF